MKIMGAHTHTHTQMQREKEIKTVSQNESVKESTTVELSLMRVSLWRPKSGSILLFFLFLPKCIVYVMCKTRTARSRRNRFGERTKKYYEEKRVGSHSLSLWQIEFLAISYQLFFAHDFIRFGQRAFFFFLTDKQCCSRPLSLSLIFVSSLFLLLSRGFWLIVGSAEQTRQGETDRLNKQASNHTYLCLIHFTV